MARRADQLDKGIGNGSSLIIFASFVAAMPDALTRFLAGGGLGSVGGLTVLFMALLVIGTIAAICYFERAPVASRSSTPLPGRPEDVLRRVISAPEDQRLA